MNALQSLLNSYVEKGIVPGVAAAIAEQGGDVLMASAGFADLGWREPMTCSTQLRIYSLTKPMIACAVLQLAERGMVGLDDPVADYLPAFRHLKVRGADRIVSDACTVRTLLNMTSGIVPFFRDDSEETAQLRREIIEQELPFTTIGLADRIAEIPLAFLPGTGFIYGMSYEVLAALIEVASGQKLSEYLRQWIFDPLRMDRTAFHITCPKHHADILRMTPDGLKIANEARYKPVEDSPGIEWGGDGLYSTVEDYLRFLTDLTFDHRVISGKTLRMMITPEATHLCRDSFCSNPLLHGYGYGMGVRVACSSDTMAGEKGLGEFGWYGHTGGWSMSNIGKGVTALLVSQCLPSPHQQTVPDFSRLIYGIGKEEQSR